MDNQVEDSVSFTETVFRTVPECIKVVDSSGKLLNINPAGMQMVQAKSLEALIGASVFDFIAPEDRSDFIEFHNRVCRGQSATKVFDIIGLHGRRRTLESLGVPYSIDGRPGMLAVTRDITDQLRSEHDARDFRELNRQIIESAREGIIVYDHELRYVIWNPFVERLSGKSADDVIGKLPWDVFPFLKQLDVETFLRRALAGESLVMPDHSNPWGVDGAAYWVMAHLSPLRNSDGRIIGVINFLHDIHQRKLAEQSLQVSHQKLNALSRRLLELQELERRHIARELHDEIGQVLTAIKMNLRRIQGSSDPAKERILDENMQLIGNAISQVRRLSVNLRPIQLDELGLVAAIHGLTKQFAHCEGLQFHLNATLAEVRFPPEIEIACFRIVQEAVTNAVRHAGAKNIDIQIAEEDRCIHASVRDDGLGFDRYVTRTQTMRGESFGLSSMEERAVHVGGQLSIHSTPGSGTLIDLRVPITDETSQTQSNE